MEQEAGRLAALDACGVLDGPVAAELDAVVRVAAHVAGTATATVNILTADRQCQLGSVGFTARDTARTDSMCDLVVRTGVALHLADASLDERFTGNPWVDGRLAHVRMYASSPLVTESGDVLGTLCVFDTVARRLDPEQLARLGDLARVVVLMLERLRLARRQEELAREAHEQRVLAERARAELAVRLEFTRTLLDTVDVGIVAVDADGHLTTFNRTTQAWHGMAVDPTLDQDRLADRYTLYDADGSTPLEPARIPVIRALREGTVRGAEIVIAPHGQPQVRVLCAGQRMHGPAGESLGAVVAMSDVTELRRRQAELRASERRFRTTLEHAPNGIVVLDGHGTLVELNRAFRDWVGEDASLLGRPLLDLVHPEETVTVRDAITAVLGGGRGSTDVDCRLGSASGGWGWARVSLARVEDGAGGGQLVAQVADLSRQRATEEHLTRLALRDDLTGLGNRALLTSLLADDPARGPGAASADGHDGRAVVFADLDDFKVINDTHGHRVGDEVLVEVARRLRAVVRPGDTVVRLGGDEFVVVCESSAGPVDAERVARRLLRTVEEPIVTSAGVLRVGISVGTSRAGGARPLGDVLAAADEQMYAEKRRRREAVRT